MTSYRTTHQLPSAQIRTSNLPANVITIMCSQRCSCIESGKRCTNNEGLDQHKPKNGGIARQFALLTFLAKRQSVCVSRTTVGSSPLTIMSELFPEVIRPHRCNIAWAQNDAMRGQRSNDVPPNAQNGSSFRSNNRYVNTNIEI